MAAITGCKGMKQDTMSPSERSVDGEETESE